MPQRACLDLRQSNVGCDCFKDGRAGERNALLSLFVSNSLWDHRLEKAAAFPPTGTARVNVSRNAVPPHAPSPPLQ